MSVFNQLVVPFYSICSFRFSLLYQLTVFPHGGVPNIIVFDSIFLTEVFIIISFCHFSVIEVFLMLVSPDPESDGREMYSRTPPVRTLDLVDPVL